MSAAVINAAALCDTAEAEAGKVRVAIMLPRTDCAAREVVDLGEHGEHSSDRRGDLGGEPGGERAGDRGDDRCLFGLPTARPPEGLRRSCSCGDCFLGDERDATLAVAIGDEGVFGLDNLGVRDCPADMDKHPACGRGESVPMVEKPEILKDI